MASTPRKSAQRKISSPARSQGLTVKQQRAVEKFVATGSMIEAYRCAYACEQMSPKCLYARAKELFENPRVAARVRALRQQSMDAAVLDRQEALAILSDIARGQISNYLDDDGAIDPRAIKAMGGPDIERLELHTAQGRQKALLRLRDPIRAIDRIARLEGWDEPERLGVGQVTISIDTGSDMLSLRAMATETMAQGQAQTQGQGQAQGQAQAQDQTQAEVGAGKQDGRAGIATPGAGQLPQPDEGDPIGPGRVDLGEHTGTNLDMAGGGYDDGDGVWAGAGAGGWDSASNAGSAEQDGDALWAGFEG